MTLHRNSSKKGGVSSVIIGGHLTPGKLSRGRGRKLKMPDFCAAYGCSNHRCGDTRARGITFHLFPKNGERRREWELAVRRKGFAATDTTLLCSEHFRSEDFDRTGQTVRLRHGVKPSIFCFTTHPKTPVAKRTTRTSRKAEESLPVVSTPRVCEARAQPNVDHTYAWLGTPAALKARLNEALARVESLEREKRNAIARERRAKKYMHVLLDYLKEKNLINEELKDRLECLSDPQTDRVTKKGYKVTKRRREFALSLLPEAYNSKRESPSSSSTRPYVSEVSEFR